MPVSQSTPTPAAPHSTMQQKGVAIGLLAVFVLIIAVMYVGRDANWPYSPARVAT